MRAGNCFNVRWRATLRLVPSLSERILKADQIMKIAVVLPNWIGDVAMATPTLRALSNHYGTEAEIVGVMRPYVAEVLEGTSWLTSHVYYDHKSTDRELRGRAMIRKLRAMNLDSIILLTNSLRGGMIGWLSGARRRVGYARGGRSLLLTDRLVAPRDGKKFKPITAVDYYLNLVKHLGCDVDSPRLELATTKANERAADQVWKKLHLNNGKDTIAFCPGSAFGPAKHWPNEHFAELASRIADSRACNVLVTCGPAERENARTIVQLASRATVVSLADEELSIGLTKACLKRSRLAVATDSGPRHIAAGFGVPTVALFGSTDPQWTINYNRHELRLSESVPCGPCAERTCPLEHHRCMKDLSVERVFKAVQSLIAWSHQSKAA